MDWNLEYSHEQAISFTFHTIVSSFSSILITFKIIMLLITGSLSWWGFLKRDASAFGSDSVETCRLAKMSREICLHPIQIASAALFARNTCSIEQHFYWIQTFISSLFYLFSKPDTPTFSAKTQRKHKTWKFKVNRNNRYFSANLYNVVRYKG